MLRISKNKVIILEPNWHNPICLLDAIITKEERGILHVGYRKIIGLLRNQACTLQFIEPFPFHLWLMRTPYVWFSKLFGLLGFKHFFGTYILTIKK